MGTGALKGGLTRIGARCSERTLHRLNAIVSYVEVGAWMRSRGLEPTERVPTRDDVFDRVAREVSDREVLYLEFGVFRGESIRKWSAFLSNPNASLHGFDSFEGLPTAWAGMPSGYFSTEGNVPAVDDGRIEFFRGWFDDTLPSYAPPPHDVLVINVDSDLYSSAALVLKTLEAWIIPGTYVYFDEFSDRNNELRAFDEFVNRTGWDFRLVAANTTLTHVAFQRIA